MTTSPPDRSMDHKRHVSPECIGKAGCSHSSSCTGVGRCLDAPNPNPLEGAELDAAINRYLQGRTH